MDTAAFSKALKANGFDLFTDQSSYSDIRAKKNLDGRTHYYSDDTMRYFKAKILLCHITDGGLLLGTVESVAHPDRGRIYRPVFFDIWGTVVSKCDIDDAPKTSKTAEKLFWRLANELDAIAITREGLERHRRRVARQLEEANTVLALA
jgi:hypothetical protein